MQLYLYMMEIENTFFFVLFPFFKALKRLRWVCTEQSMRIITMMAFSSSLISPIFYKSKKYQSSSIIIKKMGILQRFKNIARMGDFFNTSEMLRYKDESDYKTVIGGLISWVVIIALLIGFFGMLSENLAHKKYNSMLEVTKVESPSPLRLSTGKNDNFMFAIQVLGIDLSSTTRYFDIKFLEKTYKSTNYQGSKTLTLQKCTAEHWSSVSPSTIENLPIGKWLCPPMNSNFDIYGKFISKDYKYYSIQAHPCTNASNPSKPCATPTAINQLFIDFNYKFYFDFYFVNPTLNLNKKQYKTLYVDDKNYAVFGSNAGDESFFYFSDYTVKSDHSIFPFGKFEEEKGAIVEQYAINYPTQRSTATTAYATWAIAKSDSSLVYTRSVEKLSMVFAVIGGIIASVVAILFILNIYNSAAFEMSMAVSIFSLKSINGDESTKRPNPSINIWSMLKLGIYKLGKLVNKPCNWPQIAYLDRCQTEVLHHMDLKSLVKRLIFLQHSLTYVFEDYQLDGLQMRKPETLAEIRRTREKCQSILESQRALLRENSNSSEEAVQNSAIQLNSRSEEKTAGNAKVAPQKGLIMGNKDLVDEIAMEGSGQIRVIRGSEQIDQEIENKRIAYLSSLQKDAEKGNTFSKKIWNSLKDTLNGKMDANDEKK